MTTDTLTRALAQSLHAGNYDDVIANAQEAFEKENHKAQVLNIVGLAQAKKGQIFDSMSNLFNAIQLNPKDHVFYVNAAMVISAFPNQFDDSYLNKLKDCIFDSLTVIPDVFQLSIKVFDQLKFSEVGESAWKDRVFQQFALPYLQALIEKGVVDFALSIESQIYVRYLRAGGEDYEERFVRSTRQWYRMMEQMGEKVAIAKKLPANKGLKKHNNKIAFFIHNESTLAHIGTVFSILESYKNRGDCWFEATVYAMDGFSQEMRDTFAAYGVDVVNLGELKPGTAYLERLLHLRELLRENKTERLVWVCLTTMMCFAFGLRIAREQIWFCGSFYRGLEIKNIDHRALNSILADKVYENDNEWNVMQFSVGNLCKPIDEVRDEVQQARESLLQGKYDCIVGVLAREQKMQDKRYIEAVANILKNNPRTLFVWTGMQHDPTIQSFIDEFGIQEQSKYLGWIDTAVYSHVIDIFLDTFPFPCGVTLYQAMAAGKASISLRTSDAINMGVHGQLLSVFEDLPQYKIEEPGASRLREIFGESGERFLCYDQVDEYITMAGKLINDKDFRTSIGDANQLLANEFFMDGLKMSRSFDKLLGHKPKLH